MTRHQHDWASVQLPDDAELELLTEYVGGFMTEQQAEAFEERLADDEGFFTRVSPLLDEWYKPGLLPIEIEIANRLAAERGAPRRGGFGRRRQMQVVLGMAAAAALTFVMFEGRGKKTVVVPNGVAQQITPHDTASPAAAAPVQLAKKPAQKWRPAPILEFGETPADRALAQSVQAPALSPGITQSEAPASISAQERPITAVVQSQDTQDTTRQNVEERVGDAINPGKNAGASKGVEGGGFWDWVKSRLRGWKRRMPVPPTAPRPPFRAH